MSISNNELKEAQRFQVIKDFLKGRSWPTKTSIRWYIHFNKYGFADRCVKRVGRRVLIDALEFESWVNDFDPMEGAK